jgi:hypothetical protein
MTRNVKMILSVLGFGLMFGMTIYASSHQNLFTEFDFSGSPEWFHATLVDFYINQIILWFWVAAIEKKNIVKAFWLVFFICFGSMGTTLYIIVRLIQNKSLLKRE